MKAPWILRLIYSPPEALDLVDDKGYPDHGKMLGVIFFVTVVVLKVTGISFSLGELIVLGSAIFGGRAWMAFLKSRTVTSMESVLVDLRPPRDADSR